MKIFQYPNTLINQWKKYLLIGGKHAMEHWLSYWQSMNDDSQNRRELIKFCKGYLHDLRTYGGINPPGEFNLVNYRNVT